MDQNGGRGIFSSSYLVPGTCAEGWYAVRSTCHGRTRPLIGLRRAAFKRDGHMRRAARVLGSVGVAVHMCAAAAQRGSGRRRAGAEAGAGPDQMRVGLRRAGVHRPRRGDGWHMPLPSRLRRSDAPLVPRFARLREEPYPHR